ncbi:E3 ubiquitin-protein ligase UHRF2-like [Carassius auratus]|uniref:E3 ubiquitin-protein ligase UHRF2-like n=1 Tax=Carassius auratus TaxID=7957 RepID=A0A6P6NXC8_CARAU|nr:E3 ubiquitin-protein ligase UHRF2-like [Carassius auratus]
MVVVRFLESEATLQGIIGKVQDAIGCHDPMVLTDVQGNAILESEGTTGSQYWKQNARKILAIQEQAFQEVQGSKRRRMSRKDEDAAGIGEVTEKIEELVLASQTLPDITAAIRELTNLAATQRVILTPSQLQTIKQGFCCVICMKFIEEPVFTECCRSIIGCKTCVVQWQETSVHCAKCRGNTANNTIYEINGLSDTFSVLRSLYEEE